MTLDVQSNSLFVLQASRRQFNENLTASQMSLKAFFHTPLQLSVRKTLYREGPDGVGFGGGLQGINLISQGQPILAHILFPNLFLLKSLFCEISIDFMFFFF